MTEEEIKEAEKSFRVSVYIWKWCFIIYGNWKWRIIRFHNQQFFEVFEFHPFRAELNYDEKVKAGLVEKPEWWDEVEKIKTANA